MLTIGRYEILRELGRGGMATVHLARQADLGRLAALKELEMLRATDPSVAQRFLREARMAGSLSHPNIVTVYEYFEQGGTPYIAMEYVDGGSLRAHVTQEPSLAQIGGVLEGLLAGLDYAARQGIVHRDLKPENVLLTSEGRVKITDFGISKASDQVMTAASLTVSGTTIGTPAYMAPEQAMGRPVSPRTDLYSLGVIAFELLIGRAPFAGTETPMGVLLRQVNDPVPAVDSIRDDIDPRLSDWVGRLLAKEPDDRPPSAAVASEELDEILEAQLGHRWRREAALPILAAAEPLTAAFAATPSTEPIAAPTRPWTDTHAWPAAGIGAAAGVAAGAGMHDRTLAPAMPMAAPAPDPTERARRRARPFPLIVAAFVLIAAVAALAGTVGGSRGTPATAPATAAPTAGDLATPANPPNPSNPSNPSNPPNTNNPNNADSGSSVGDSGNSGSSGSDASSNATDGGNGENADDGGDDGTSAANP